ncbi:MAG: replication-associated recombination protein A [Parachlamydiales bacterium]|jgi:putative ATPase
MYVPLAEKMRPNDLADVVGQEHLLGPGSLISSVIERKTPLSLLLWGPPGCGKTTIARLYAKAFDASFFGLSAVHSGTTEIKKIIQQIQDNPLLHRLAVLFIDEIHRFNKAQQDVLLPFLEKGTFVLVGATTENPSFTLNNALLSRLRVLTLKPLDDSALEVLLKRYEERHSPLGLTEEAKNYLIGLSHGDGRYLLNLIENIQGVFPEGIEIPLEELKNLLQRRAALFDRQGDGHYNLISALHKSVRGSDPDAALYWFARMLEGGEDPLYLARRLIRMAVEDVGLADPQALQIAMNAREAYHVMGSPEGELALAQVVVYLALAPKSNALYTAFGNAKRCAAQTGQLQPPAIILNAPTKLMEELGYGDGYQYDHEQPDAFSGQEYFPDGMAHQHFYHPVERGFEREMVKRMAYFQRLRQKRL